MLGEVNHEARELTKLYQGRFLGDPAHEFEVAKYDITDENTAEENTTENKVIQREMLCDVGRNASSFSFFFVKKND